MAHGKDNVTESLISGHAAGASDHECALSQVGTHPDMTCKDVKQQQANIYVGSDLGTWFNLEYGML